METGSLGEDINPWGVELFRTLQDVELQSPQQEAAYGKWLDQTSTREEARQDRIDGASGVIPVPLWIALFFISAIVLALLLGFADRGERWWVQALFMGSVVSIIVTLLLLLQFLDDPFHSGVGGLQPVAMERAELLIYSAARGDRRLRDDPLRRGRDRDATAPVPTKKSANRLLRDWIEIVATVVLASSAVATVWSSYQATRWNGETTKATGRVNALRIEGASAQVLAEAQTQVDIAMSFQWINATATDDPSSPGSTPSRSGPSSAQRSTLAGDRIAGERRRSPVSVCHGPVPAAGPVGGGTARR